MELLACVRCGQRTYGPSTGHRSPAKWPGPCGRCGGKRSPAFVDTDRVQPRQVLASLGLAARFVGHCFVLLVAGVVAAAMATGRWPWAAPADDPGRTLGIDHDILMTAGIVALLASSVAWSVLSILDVTGTRPNRAHRLAGLAVCAVAAAQYVLAAFPPRGEYDHDGSIPLGFAIMVGALVLAWCAGLPSVRGWLGRHLA